MPATLNFIWIGEPRYHRGGQDIVGPVSIALNLKKFSNSTENPIIFWCQNAHVRAYQHFFLKRNLSVYVNSIEAYLLKSQSTSCTQASTVLTYYHDLTAAHRNRTRDHVTFKDMFAHFILAMEGNYVMDTNVQTDLNRPVTFPTYPYSMFPEVKVHKNATIIEMWLLYAPPQHLQRAKECLDTYLSLYEYFIYHKSNEKPGYLYSSSYHAQCGKITIAALCKVTIDDLTQIQNNQFNYKDWCVTDIQSDRMRVWEISENETTKEIYVPALHVAKEYASTHMYDAQNEYSKYFKYIHFKETSLAKLSFACNHGLDPNLEANPHSKGRNYEAKGITLLNYVLYQCVLEFIACQKALIKATKQHIRDEKAYPNYQTNIDYFINILKLLLQKRADPNRIHEMAHDRYQLRCWSEKTSDDEILKNTCPVIYLGNHEGKLAYIVFEGKNFHTNQSTPLLRGSTYLDARENLTNEKLYEHKPKIMASIIANGHAFPNITRQEAPLSHAIRSRSPLVIATLVKYAKVPIHADVTLNGKSMVELAKKYGMYDVMYDVVFKPCNTPQENVSSISMFARASAAEGATSEPDEALMLRNGQKKTNPS